MLSSQLAISNIALLYKLTKPPADSHATKNVFSRSVEKLQWPSGAVLQRLANHSGRSGWQRTFSHVTCQLHSVCLCHDFTAPCPGASHSGFGSSGSSRSGLGAPC